MSKETRDTAEDQSREQEQQEQTRQLNPRLVFNDPDAFFADLLMEQNEQQ